MTDDKNTAFDLIERLRRKAPEYVDLFSSQTEDEFDRAFVRVLEVALADLESGKKLFVNFNEMQLTKILSMTLRRPGLSVNQELYVNGHVDLTIELDDSFPLLRKLCETKIYRYPKYHADGVRQLLGRYTTGREGLGYLIVYVQEADIKGITQKIKEHLDRELPESQTGPCEDYLLKWSLLTKHKHNSGEIISLGHVGCNLYVDGDRAT